MKGAEKRTAILKATMELITEHGFHATPMSMIAKQAGVAAGTIYNYFPSKDVLINQLYAELKAKMGDALLNKIESSGNLREKFFMLYNNLFQYFTEQPDEFIFLEQYSNSPYISQTPEGQNLQFQEPVVDFLKGGIELGVLRNMEIELMTALLYGHVVAVAKLHLNGRLDVNENILLKSAQSCWDSVKIN